MKQNTPDNKKQWENIATVLYKRRHDLNGFLTDEDLRVRLMFFCVYIIFAAVSGIMTVVNVFSQWRLLMLSTLIYAILNMFSIVLALLSPQTEHLARILFALETAVLFLFFLFVGEPEGFSAIWLVFLPIGGLLLFGMKYGCIFTFSMLAVLVFLFWTPAGRSLLLYDGYTDSFLLRFPLLYSAAAAVGVFFEYILHTTQTDLNTTRTKFEYLSMHDPLTGLYNRFGFYSVVNDMALSMCQDGYAFAILDLDHFKNVNDRFGHLRGDEVLKTTADIIAKTVGDAGWISRWGGEEFAVFLRGIEGSGKLCTQIMKNLRSNIYSFDGESFRVTVSIGLVLVKPGEAPTLPVSLISSADENLYKSKEAGRDRMTVTTYDPKRKKQGS